MAEQAGLPLAAQLGRFAIAGVLGLAVDVAVLYGAMALGLGWFGGRALSFACAVWITWQYNRRYTFAPRPDLSVWQEWWRYLSAMLVGGAVNYAVYSLVVTVATRRAAAPAILPLLAVAAGSVAGISVNFVGARQVVFKRPTRP